MATDKASSETKSGAKKAFGSRSVRVIEIGSPWGKPRTYGHHKLERGRHVLLRRIASIQKRNEDLETRLAALSQCHVEAKALVASQAAEIASLKQALTQMPTAASEAQQRGKALAREKMLLIAKENPTDRYVGFCLDTGEYVTARTESSLIGRYETAFGDRSGWITIIVPGGYHDAKGVDR